MVLHALWKWLPLVKFMKTEKDKIDEISVLKYAKNQYA